MTAGTAPYGDAVRATSQDGVLVSVLVPVLDEIDVGRSARSGAAKSTKHSSAGPTSTRPEISVPTCQPQR